MVTSALNELISRSCSKKAQASLIAAEPDTFVIAVTEREDSKRVVTHTLRLSGKWRANDRAEVSFWLDKDEARRGVVHFGSAWSSFLQKTFLKTAKRLSGCKSLWKSRGLKRGWG